jgi:hypothetical protein
MTPDQSAAADTLMAPAGPFTPEQQASLRRLVREEVEGLVREGRIGVEWVEGSAWGKGLRSPLDRLGSKLVEAGERR